MHVKCMVIKCVGMCCVCVGGACVINVHQNSTALCVQKMCSIVSYDDDGVVCWWVIHARV